jgi:hypothetical protein
MTTNKPYIHDCIDGKPITYDVPLEQCFEGWAEACKMTPQALRTISETAIKTRHNEAVLPHPADYARGRQPNIWHLAVGDIHVIYTVEPDSVVIRGYWYESDEPEDGGGHYCEFYWHE